MSIKNSLFNDFDETIYATSGNAQLKNTKFSPEERLKISLEERLKMLEKLIKEYYNRYKNEGFICEWKIYKVYNSGEYNSGNIQLYKSQCCNVGTDYINNANGYMKYCPFCSREIKVIE
jgi:hypothetical protein